MALLINDNTPRVQYTASASQTVFAYPFAIFEDADLKVYQTLSGVDADDSADIQTLTTHYTVSGAGTTAGGNVTLVTGAAAGDIITIERDIAVERTTDYQNLGDLASETFNDDLDKMIMMVQQNESQLARTFKVQSTDSDIADFDYPTPVAGAYLRYNATKTGLEAGSLPTALTGDITSFDSMANLKAISSATDADVAFLEHYYTTSTGGGGFFYWDATSTATDNGGTIIKATAITTGRWIRLYSGDVDVRWFGAIGSGDETTELQNFFVYIYDNNEKGMLNGITYTVSGELLNKSSAGSLNVSPLFGTAVFSCATTSLETLIKATEITSAYVKGIKIDANDLVSAPFDLRNASTAGIGGAVYVENVEVLDAKQVAQSTSPVGIQVIGEFDNVTVKDSIVTNVSRTSSSKDASGIVVSDLTGHAEITGNKVTNVTFPGADPVDADGIKIFGNDVSTLTTRLTATANVSHNVVTDALGRGIKLQISHALVQSNRITLSAGVTTITDYVGVDCQANNGNIIDNRFITGAATLGTGAAVFNLQNVRNESKKVAYVARNHVETSTKYEFFAVGFSKYQHCGYVVEDNDLTGTGGCDQFFKHVMNGVIGDTDTFDVSIFNNRFYGLFRLYDDSNDAGYSGKMNLHIINNRNTKTGTQVETVNQSLTGFDVNADFIISNNAECIDRVNWGFNMDFVKSGNNFMTGSQTNTNSYGSVTTFYHVSRNGNILKNTHNNGSVAGRKTSDDGGATWNAWVAV